MRLSSIYLLISRQCKEHSRVYLIAVLLLFGLLSFMFLMVNQWRDSFTGSVENGVFLIGLFLAGGFFTNSMFRELSDSSQSIWFLTIPATQIEKLISAIILSTLVFLCVYMGVFFLADGLYAKITGQMGPNVMRGMFKNGFRQFIFLYLIFNGLVLLGRICFVKYSFLKTMVAIILAVVLLNSANNMIIESMIPNLSVTSSMLFSSFQFRQSGENILVQLPASIQTVITPLIWTLLPLALWAITWLKLKEKQI